MTDVQRCGARHGTPTVRERRESGEHPQEGRLARAVRAAKQREARPELEGYPPKDRAVVEDDRDIVERCVLRG